MSDERSHYEVLDVQPDASRDELREAYRSRVSELRGDDYKGPAERRRDLVARVNRAWNVLSDPFQRTRYDDELRAARGSEPAAEAGDDEAGEQPEPVGRAGRRARVPGPGPDPADAPPPEPTGGLAVAEPRERIYAMLVDLAVLAVLVLGVQLAARPVVQQAYPREVKQLDALGSRRDAATRRADSAGRRAAKDDAAAAAAKKQGDAAAESAAANAAAQARTDARAARRDAKRDHDQITRLQRDLAPAQYATLGASALLALAYLVPSTAITGRTLGKRLRGLRVVRVGGAPVGWGGAFARFAVPVLIATALFYSLPGLLLGLGSVLWWLRDKSRQGFHDKLARTIVVESAVEKG